MTTKSSRVVKIVGLVLLGVMVAGLLGLLLGLVVMALWNALMPDIFGLPPIGYWQAVGLFILAHLLFKPSGHPGHHHPAFRSRSPRQGKFQEKVKMWLNGEACAKDSTEVKGQP